MFENNRLRTKVWNKCFRSIISDVSYEEKSVVNMASGLYSQHSIFFIKKEWTQKAGTIFTTFFFFLTYI
jgi:hypothetical protein